MDIKKETAKILLDAKAVTLNPKNPFRYASGILSPIYCDNRLLISDVEHRLRIIDFFLDTIKQNKIKFDIVAGTATAGIPWAAWIAHILEKPMIYIRGESKDHGKENRIEGSLGKGKKALVVEDLISTGGSSISAVNAVKEAGGHVEYCLAIFSYQMKKAEDGFNNSGCKLITLSDFEALVNIAKETKYISEEERKIVLEWNKDPENWGKKYGKDN